MKNLCRYLSFFVLGFGTIGAIVLASTLGISLTVKEKGYYGTGIETVEKRDWGTTIGIFIGTMFCVVVIYVTLRALCELHEKVDTQLKLLRDVAGNVNELSKKIEISAHPITDDMASKLTASKVPVKTKIVQSANSGC